MRAVLVKNRVWGYVSGDIPKPAPRDGNEDEVKSWERMDERAKADLVLSMGRTELRVVKNCDTSKAMWEKLENTYQPRGSARKAALLRKLITFKMDEHDDMAEHVRKFYDLKDRLNEADLVMNEELLVMVLLNSLPPSYDNFRRAIELRDNLPKLEQLRIKLLE